MFQFQLDGVVAQKQTRYTCPCKKGHMYDPSKRDKEMIQWQSKPFAPEVPVGGPIEMTLVFYLAIPKHTSKVRRQAMLNRKILPIIKPDEDNLAYLVTNALKKIFYADDKQIVAKHVYKFYGEKARTIVMIKPILQLDTVGLDLPEGLCV